MVQLLQKLSIRATNGPDKLLKVVKGPVTKYFPPGAPPRQPATPRRRLCRAAAAPAAGAALLMPSLQALLCCYCAAAAAIGGLPLTLLHAGLAASKRPLHVLNATCKPTSVSQCVPLLATRPPPRLPPPPWPPADAQRIGFSHSAKSIVVMHQYVARPEVGDRPLVFVVGPTFVLRSGEAFLGYAAWGGFTQP